MSVEVQRQAFIYFITHTLSTKRANLNCLLNDAQKMEWWPPDVVYLELQNLRTNVLFQCLSCAFL